MTKERRIPKIIELLRNNDLTSIEIAKKLNIPKNNCASYLTALRKSGRIVRISDNIPYKYKLAMNREEILELLKFSNNFFKDNIDYLLKDPKISEYILSHEEFDKIEELVK